MRRGQTCEDLAGILSREEMQQLQRCRDGENNVASSKDEKEASVTGAEGVRGRRGGNTSGEVGRDPRMWASRAI